MFLSSFIVLGLSYKDLSLSLIAFLLTFGSAVLTQIAFERIFKQKRSSVLSAIISSLSICLLIRSNAVWAYPVLSVLAIGSKFMFKSHQQHIFNPANFAIVFALIFIEPVWISDAFWGHSNSLMIWLLFLGLVVTQKTQVHLPSLAFLIFYFSLTALKTFYLGFEFLVWSHELQSGALMIFTFFMLSDPKTSPDSRKEQLIYAGYIAILSFVLKHLLFINNAFFYSLLIACFISNFILKRKPNTFAWLSQKL